MKTDNFSEPFMLFLFGRITNMYNSIHPGRRDDISVADLREEVEEQFDQVINTFDEPGGKGTH